MSVQWGGVSPQVSKFEQISSDDPPDVSSRGSGIGYPSPMSGG